MRRREFITLIGGHRSCLAAGRSRATTVKIDNRLSWQRIAGCMGRATPRIAGLSESSFVEGQNLSVEYRWAQGRNERLPSMAADLVREQVKVIIAPGSTPAALAAQAATKTIPIVFEIASDPVELGLVSGLSKPGGNVTGVTTLNLE